MKGEKKIVIEIGRKKKFKKKKIEGEQVLLKYREDKGPEVNGQDDNNNKALTD